MEIIKNRRERLRTIGRLMFHWGTGGIFASFAPNWKQSLIAFSILAISGQILVAMFPYRSKKK